MVLSVIRLVRDLNIFSMLDCSFVRLGVNSICILSCNATLKIICFYSKQHGCTTVVNFFVTAEVFHLIFIFVFIHVLEG